ncbi:MAG: site-2 protease family protein [Acidimicrobiia bacterium]
MISFRLLRIPVTVRPSFLLIAALLGLSAARVSLVFAWIAVVFVSILLHEMGHALTARAFGSEVEIELNAIGGLTSWTVPEEEFGPGRRAVVAAAGSGVGVVFGGLVWLFASLTGPYVGLAGFVVNTLIYVNLFWGLLNWLPIRPLDGGHLFSSLLEKIAPRRGETIANVVFMVTAAAGLTAALYFGLTFVALLAGWLLFGELTRGRPRRPQVPIPPMSFDRPPPDPEPEEVDG